jgi:hypothetical protein
MEEGQSQDWCVCVFVRVPLFINAQSLMHPVQARKELMVLYENFERLMPT